MCQNWQCWQYWHLPLGFSHLVQKLFLNLITLIWGWCQEYIQYTLYIKQMHKCKSAMCFQCFCVKKSFVSKDKCQCAVYPIWWFIEYPVNLEHRTNRLDVGTERKPPRKSTWSQKNKKKHGCNLLGTPFASRWSRWCISLWYLWGVVAWKEIVYRLSQNVLISFFPGKNPLEWFYTLARTIQRLLN